MLLEDLVNQARRSPRGKGAGIDDPTTHDAHGVHERQSVGILPDRLGGTVDQAAHGAMGEHEPVDVLAENLAYLTKTLPHLAATVRAERTASLRVDA